MTWVELRLGDVLDVKHGFAFDGQYFADTGEYVLLTPGHCLEQGGFRDKGDGEKYFIGNFPEDFLLRKGDLVVVMTDLINRAPILGGSFFVPVENRYLHNQRLGKVRVTDPARIDTTFLHYLLNTREYRAQVRGSASGATVRHTSPGRIKNCVVRVPREVAMQRRIACVLSAYDELRENDGRRMALLQDAARQLYREWFVRLRFPGREHTRVVDGLPERWERRELRRCATFLSGGTPSKAREDYWDGDIPWASSGELTELRIAGTPLRITAEAAEVGSRLVPRETILAVVRGMSLAKEWRISLTSREMAFNQDLKAIVANEDVNPLYLFHALDAQRDQVRDRAGEASHGTKRLETAVLSALPILVPPHPLQMLFREHVEPMHALWDNLHRQNEKLRAARDFLLPRLMSGELAV